MQKIKEICQNLGVRPLKRKGQNFLINPKILEILVRVAELKKDDFVLEIGPGLGILTQELAKKVKKVIAVEIDQKLVEFLKEKFKNQKNVEIIQGDILKFSILNFQFSNFKLVANLPYSITGAVLRKFLTERPKPKLIVLMLQKEVAERIVEKNGKKSIISLMVNFYGQPEIVKYISKNNFWPRPKIGSAIIRITRINADKKRGLMRIDENKFFQLIRQGFSSPRKQLVNNLAKIIKKEKLKKILEKIGLKAKVRAEDLDLKNWLKIYQNIHIFVKNL